METHQNLAWSKCFKRFYNKSQLPLTILAWHMLLASFNNYLTSSFLLSCLACKLISYLNYRGLPYTLRTRWGAPSEDHLPYSTPQASKGVRTHSTFKGWAFNFQCNAPPPSSKWWLLFQAPSNGHQSVWLRRREVRWKLCFQLSTLIFSLLKMRER